MKFFLAIQDFSQFKIFRNARFLAMQDLRALKEERLFSHAAAPRKIPAWDRCEFLCKIFDFFYNNTFFQNQPCYDLAINRRIGGKSESPKCHDQSDSVAENIVAESMAMHGKD